METLTNSITLIALLSVLPSISSAQNLLEARIDGQPLIYLKEGNIQGCGVRLFSVQLDAVGSTGKSWDVSFSYWTNGLAVAKGLAYDIDVRELKAGKKPRNARLEQFSIKAPNVSATRPRENRILSGEEAGSIMYVIDLGTALDLFKAIAAKETFTVSIRRPEERTDRLYFGIPALTDTEREQLMNCVGEAAR
jgi:hypothetical protein